ncbi:MAG TPA: hypothetical protein VKI61_11950 [Chitinophagaceae bacterium]|jgi:hypothetical protein|nr:hypothetical protein [Chitinophagaceae bacterium]
MKVFMKSIEINFRYWGDVVVANVFQEEDYRGVVYPIKLNGYYFFTLRYTEKNEWLVVKERNGIRPSIDKELLSRILKPLETQLHYAA